MYCQSACGASDVPAAVHSGHRMRPGQRSMPLHQACPAGPQTWSPLWPPHEACSVKHVSRGTGHRPVCRLSLVMASSCCCSELLLLLLGHLGPSLLLPACLPVRALVPPLLRLSPHCSPPQFSGCHPDCLLVQSVPHGAFCRAVPHPWFGILQSRLRTSCTPNPSKLRPPLSHPNSVLRYSPCACLPVLAQPPPFHSPACLSLAP